MFVSLTLIGFIISSCAIFCCADDEYPGIDAQTLRKARQTTRLTATGPCTCLENPLTCSCCANIDVPVVQFNKEGCIRVSFTGSPDLGAKIQFDVNGRPIISRQISGTNLNPPPICIPMRGMPWMTICTQITNTPGQNGQSEMCLTMELKIGQQSSGIKMPFGCMKYGQNGTPVSGLPQLPQLPQLLQPPQLPSLSSLINRPT